MTRMSKWLLASVFSLLLVLSLSAGSGTAPAAKANSPTPRTLVSTSGPIRSFAQSAEAIAWVDRLDRVYVKRLAKRTIWRVGSAFGNGGRATYTYSPLLTLIGARAFWTTYDGGNLVEIAVYSGLPGDRHRTLVDVLGSDPDGSGMGSFFSGLVSDGPRLVDGFAVVTTPGGDWPTDCTQLILGDRGIARIASPPYRYGRSSRPKNMPSVMMLAASQGRIAVVPAAFDGQRCPELRIAENGPVEVYGIHNSKATLVSSVAPHGYVKAIALSPTQLAVLVQRANGPRLIERYDPRNGAMIGTTPVSSSTAFELGISSAGIVYRVGTKILFIGPSGVPKLIWNARARPIGISIVGRRIGWAENVKGHGRIVALTAPSSAQMATGSDSAAAPTRNGDILFGSIRVKSGSRLLYLMGPDGRHQRRLGTARNVWSPGWSPGGKWIAYGATTRNGGLCPQLYVMRADGTHARRLTHDHGCYLNPTWAPGGKRIAFDRWGGTLATGMWTMNIDGSGLRLLARGKGNTPAWSPDGRTIAFRGPAPDEAIWLMDADGTSLRQLPTPHGASAPAWSPNSKWIAFSAGNIYVIRSDGSGLRQLTAHARTNTMPAWSPDGTRIAFVSSRAHRDLGDIYVMKVDGTGQKRLTRNIDNQWPDWRAR